MCQGGRLEDETGALRAAELWGFHLGSQAFGVGLDFGKSCMEILYILLDREMIDRDQCFLMYVKLTARENVFRCVKRWHS